MKLEKLEDLLEINTDTGKATDNKKLLADIKRLLKKEAKRDVKVEKAAGEMPYIAVSVVGNKYVEVSFNLETKEALVSTVSIDERDANGRSHMAVAKAEDKVYELSKTQRPKEEK